MGQVDKNDLKAEAKGQWRSILLSFGFSESQLNGVHQPCYFCGGTDRYRWIEKQEKSFCSQCTRRYKDGIDMVSELNGWNFSQTIEELGDFLGLKGISNSERRDRAEARERAEKAIKQAELEAYYNAKEYEYHFAFVLKGEKYTEESINRLDSGQSIIKKYELKYPSVRKTERYRNEVKFWNQIMEVDTKFEMLANYIGSKLLVMKKAGKSQAEIGQAFNSIANNSKYGNETLKAKVIYLMQHPEVVQDYTITDLHIKNHADNICKLKTRQERIEMLADVPEKYRAGVAEVVALEFKLKQLC